MSDSNVSRPQRWDVPFCVESGLHVPLDDDQVDRLLTVDPFDGIDPEGFKSTLSLRGILKNDVTVVDFDDSEVIVRRGDWGSSAFFILEGSVRVELEGANSRIPDQLLGRRQRRKKSLFESIAQLWKNSRHAEVRDASSATQVSHDNARAASRIYLPELSQVLDERRTATIEAGQWFGELAALGRTARVATVVSIGKTQLLEIRWQGLRDIMRYDRNGNVRRHIEERFREHALGAFLRNESLFQNCSDILMQEIIENCEFRSYGDYDTARPFQNRSEVVKSELSDHEPVVVEEGDYLNGLVMVRSGVARLSCRHHNGRRTVGYLSAGHSVGLPQLIESFEVGHQVEYDARLSAIGYLNVVIVPVHLVEKVLKGAIREQARDWDSNLTGSASSVDSTHVSSKRVDTNLLKFLVDDQFVQATSLMVIDLDRCTRCDDCVRACATGHDNNSRFIRQGPQFGNLMVANACLHCVDPVCMIECPTGAIHRDQHRGEIVINERTCIGCTQCAENCPFDAIRMVNIRDRAGDVIVDSSSQLPLLQATKCDLCIDQRGGPACQRACPHDALKRVNMQDDQAVAEALAK